MIAPFKKLGGYLGICFFLLAGCTVGPDYEKPVFDLENAWHNKLKQTATHADDLKWWENFNDPLLTTLIDMGMKNNLDLKLAEAKILQSRSALKLSKANLYPNVSGRVSSTHDAVSKDSLITSNGKTKRFYELYTAEFDATWELDLFGRLRRSKESSAASLEASIANADAVFLTLIAEIARNYIILRSNQQQLLINEKIYKCRQRQYLLAQDLLKSGLATDLDVTQAKVVRDKAFAQILPLKANIKSAIHRLSILMGQQPSLLYPVLQPTGKIPMVSSKVLVGLPSEIIERRPDVREAERKLAAATSQIGVAKGEIFPKFTLTGNVGYSSLTGGNLLEPGSLYFTVGPSATFSIFDFGRIRANIENAEILRDQALISYKQTIYNALEDVENTLVRYSSEENRYATLKGATLSSQQMMTSKHNRYKAGINKVTEVLEDQITYLNNHMDMVQSQETLAQNTVKLYKALGGGWQTYTPKEKKD